MNEYSWGIAVGILIIAATVGKGVAAVLRAHAARIDRSDRTTEDPQLAETVEALRQRVGELEERVDFTERILAKQRETDRLASPQRGSSSAEPRGKA
jgi:ribonuclease D